MRSERLCSLGRHLQNLPKDALDTYSAQWFERSLVRNKKVVHAKAVQALISTRMTAPSVVSAFRNSTSPLMPVSFFSVSRGWLS